MNLVRIEAGEDFLYYHEGISPLVASVLERLDQERVAVARALGVPVLPVLDWLHSKYGSRGGSLYEALQQTEAYAAVLGPKDIHTRYLYEDVPTGCVSAAGTGPPSRAEDAGHPVGCPMGLHRLRNRFLRDRTQ